ncbi:MAG TPA: threonine/serine dehydratase [Stackebrandtia sp.]|jgi:threonine dehydratase|uniref:threonine ammonia-lyase n=1 Tax=Stackebrandtia sp. TaxID=2023065 RepID=UPI002D564157|nr:threonine/serine dehydratase [Stackebrandtia sp.]HZE38813.1 threonine/serine dehydratase [Stackebrandtia sp.]
MEPTITDMLHAARRIAPHLSATPLLNHPALDAETGARVFVKHENLQPTGAFKVRGGINLLSRMDESERRAGVVGYSTGNHAQSLAHASRLFGAPCRIVMPRDPNPVKAAAVTALGAELIEHGAVFDDTKARASELAEHHGARLVSAANEPDLIAGVGTLYLELLAARPEIDAILVPVGSGSSAAAACLAAEALSPGCRVIAVQSRQASAAHDSFRAGELVDRPNQTVAEGLATGSGFELPQAIMRKRLDDFVLVDDAEIRAAQWTLMRTAHTVAEGAGACALAGLTALGERLAGATVAIVCSGGNASPAELRRVIPE